jgi:hypothetical protein
MVALVVMNSVSRLTLMRHIRWVAGMIFKVVEGVYFGGVSYWYDVSCPPYYCFSNTTLDTAASFR